MCALDARRDDLLQVAVAKFQKSSEAVQRIDKIIDGVIDRLQGDEAKELKKVKDIIDNLEE